MDKQQIITFRDRLNSVSPSFCVAKWKQVTIHLALGKTHSCHLPDPHFIPLSELREDPSALHNTKYKLRQQQTMLPGGERPIECSSCWKVEDSDPNGEVFSDRIMKSADVWAEPFVDEIAANPAGPHNPSYVELSFSNVCNLKCSYCSPEVSSKWLQEIKKFGPYPTSNSFNDIKWLQPSTDEGIIPEMEVNPYVEAFWKWLPDLYRDLRVLRISGGEPLLTEHTFTLIDYILANPHPELEFSVNSNLCVSKKVLDKFIKSMKKVQDAGAVKSFKLYTSCEAHGNKAEYTRFGLDYNLWKDNCNRILDEIPRSKLTVMSTYNVLSVTSYKEFLNDMLIIRREHSTETSKHRVGVDMPYLRGPEHQSMAILTPDYMHYVEDQLSFVKEPHVINGYHDYEINRMDRVYRVFKDYMSREVDRNILKHRRDFVRFFDEHDRRRGTNFLKTFPEMEDFYNLCKNPN